MTDDGEVLLGPGEIERGQNVWQAMGGMQLGSIWGHGSYVAPDWSAEWLHREAMHMLDDWAMAEDGVPYERASGERRAALQSRLQSAVRPNRYDPQTGVLTIDPARARAFEANAAYLADVFGNGRSDYAIPAGALSDPGTRAAAS